MSSVTKATPKVLEEVNELFREGLSVRAVAARVGVSELTLRQWSKDGKVSGYEAAVRPRKMTPAVVLQAQGLLDAGESCYAVSKALGVSHLTVATAIRKGILKGVMQNRKHDEAAIRDVQALLEAGHSRAGAAKVTGIPYATIVSWASKGVVTVAATEARQARRSRKIHNNREAIEAAYEREGPFETKQDWVAASGISYPAFQAVWKSDEDRFQSMLLSRAEKEHGYRSLLGSVDVCRNEREREILTLRASGKSLGDIAKRYGVTRERVRQVLLRVELAAARLQRENNEG